MSRKIETTEAGAVSASASASPKEVRTTERIEPSFWAVIPAQVRYAAEIPAGAKLLYAEISSLTDQRGYCFATNKYFADLYGVGVRTVQRWLGALQNAGVIRITDDAGGSDQRKIFAGINPLAAEPATEMSPPHDKNVMAPATEMSRPHDKNVAVNLYNNKDNKKEEQKPPTPSSEKLPMPAALIARVEHYAGEDLQLRDALLEFAKMRDARKKSVKTKRQLTLLLSKLNELSCGRRRDKLAIIEKATVNCWLSFYPLHEDDLPPHAPPDGRSVESPEVARW